MTQAPILELIICTYNNAALLEQVLTTIAAQQVANSTVWSVVVVNNNCTDDTETVVNRAIQAGQIPNLRMIHEPIQGLTPARLCGVQYTTAPWIAFVDDDCLLQPNWVAAAVAFATQHPACGGFGGRVTLQWETPPPAYVLNFTYSFAEQEQGDQAKQVESLVGAGMVLNRAALRAVGWTTRQFLADRTGCQLVSGGDVEIALRVSTHYDLWYNPACQILHYIPAHRTTYPYLRRINYGLGLGKLFADSLGWRQSYPAWVWVSVRQAWRQTIYAGYLAYQALLGRQSLHTAQITFHFWRGYWVGIWRLAQMESSARQRLIGGALIVGENPLPSPLPQEIASW